MKNLKLQGVTLIMAVVLSSWAPAAQAQSKRTVSQYNELVYNRSCAGRRVAVGPLWAVTPGAFLLTWDCDMHEYQKADTAVRAFERKNPGVLGTSSRSVSPGKKCAWVPWGAQSC